MVFVFERLLAWASWRTRIVYYRQIIPTAARPGELVLL
jgi:hypothetical protein